MAVKDYLYHYKAIMSRVIDGDIIVFKDIDMGLDIVVKRKKARLLGINTPELHASDELVRMKAKKAKEYLQGRLTEDMEVVIKIKEYDSTDAFGRILADVYIDDENLNDTILNLGLAVEFDRS